MKDEQYLQPTIKWVKDLVVGLNLCPFAKRELVKNRIRFIVSHVTKKEELLTCLQQELELLNSNDNIETTLLIHPAVLQDFFEYNQFLGSADDLLYELALEGVYQVASFHPNYQFGGTVEADAENYTNRSPFPMLHLLRENSLENAIAIYPDTDQIPKNNIDMMNKMGSQRLKLLLHNCFSESKG